jgi:cytochrome d ubiquinol oxidase subunit II
MEAIWYAIVAAMLTAWAVLDGFDFGVGVVHHVVARTEAERSRVLAAIGPIWDGNEVWLVASGGVFVFAFPHAYAAAMSGMYLPMMMVLWLLVFRGVAIELRGQLGDPLWRAGWDATFALASTALAFVAGVALGNVVRGVPVDASGWFHLELFAVGGAHAGAVDAYSALVGLLAVVVLAAHGATYVAWKTTDAMATRAVGAARRAWTVAMVLALAATWMTAHVRPALFASLMHRPWLWPLPLVVVGGPVVALRALGRGAPLRAFLASSSFVASLLLLTAGTLYPTLLPSTVDPAFDLDARTTASAAHGLSTGLAWWIPAMALAVLYFVNLFRSIRGKVEVADGGH